ncbi:MAG: tetratricopeptide repeat protein [Acidobacteriota bacterium]
MKTAVRTLALAVILMTIGTGAFAQLTKGIRGKVLDREGKPVADLPVRIVDEANSNNHYTVTTDKFGTYVQAGLPYSDKGYTVTVKVGDLPEISKNGKPKLMDLIEINFDMRADITVQEVKASPAAEAKALYEMGDYEGALAKANEAIAQNDNLKAALFFKAACYDQMGDTDGALAAFEAYDIQYPGETSVLGMLAKLYDKKGDAAKAAEYRKRFKEKGGQVTGETYNAGVTALNSGDARKAVELFAQATKEDPNDADAHREWSIALAQLGDYKGSIEQLRIYLKMKPDAPDAQQWKDAIAALEPLANQQK